VKLGSKEKSEMSKDEILRDILNRGLIFLFAINPAYAYRWAINNNAYTLSSILKKYEEVIRAEKEREFIDLIKLGVFLAMVFVGMGLCVYMVLLATKGQLAISVPNIVPSGGGGYRI